MKKIFLLSLVFIFSLGKSQAQFSKLKPPVLDTFSIALGKIALDFKHDYRGIQGSSLPPQGSMDVFASKVTLPGALHSVIYRFYSGVDSTSSWQAVMYDGDDYKEAVKIYKETCRKVKKSKFKWVDSTYVGFSGKIEEPNENLNFAMSSMQLDIIDLLYKQYYAEIELVSSYAGWEVHLNMHNKKDDIEQ